MKSLKTKVILSGIVLLFALIATIGTTYAWFTVSNTVAVNSFDVTVKTEQSLLGRIWDTGDSYESGTQSPNDFFNTLNVFDPNNDSTNDGYYYGGGSTGLGSWRLTPVTAVAGETTGLTDYASFDLTTFRRVDLTTTTSRAYSDVTSNVNTASGGYVTIKIYLMATTDDVDVELKSLTVTSSGNTALANAIYVGTLADSTVQNIYPVDSDWGFTFLNGDPGYSSTAALNSVTAGAKTALQALEKVPDTNDNIVVTLDTAFTPEIVTMYIWIEGWDAQATNGLMGYTLSMNFDFAII